MMYKFLGFMGVCGLGGLTYLKYYEYSKINRDLDQLIQRNELSSHLYQINEDSAFSIDSTMDAFERGYNQFSINKYRQTLAGLCEGKVLQTCAGSNRNLKYYKPGINLTLIDFSPNMVSTGSAKISPFLQYNYVLGDVMDMKFKDDEFDCVLDTFGLQYVLNPHKALSQIRRQQSINDRVCKKDGRILLMNEGISGIVEFHYWQNIKWGYNLMRGGYFSNRNWQKLIQQFDFEVEHLQRKKNGKLYIFVLRNVKKQPEQGGNKTEK